MDHLRSLGGQHVLYVAIDRPYAGAVRALEEAGIDTRHFWFLDAITAASGIRPEAAANVMFVQSPTMLEMVAMRAEQIIRRMESATVVVDSLNALVLYNGREPVQEFAHYLGNRLRSLDADLDLVVLDNETGSQIREGLSSFLDSTLTA